MTAYLEKAIEVTRALTPEMQDQAARLLLLYAGVEVDDVEPVALTDDEKAAIDVGLAAADRGDFATDEEMQALWAKFDQ